MPARVIVIGAGPIGLAAALGAHDRGCDVTVLERDDVGESLRRWGATRFFTPLRMNVSPRMRDILGCAMPGDDALLTGAEFVDRVLEPLAERDPLRGRVRTRTRVVAIGRRGLTRTDYAGHPLRAERRFRILTDTDEVIDADVVLDATGNTSHPLPYASRGESRIDAIRTLGVLDERKDELRGKRVLLVGHGHSAANAIAVLDAIGAEVTWAVRTANQRMCEEIANDPLPERQRAVITANELAARVKVERRAMVESVSRRNGHIEVTLTGGRRAEVDAVVALTGYRPASDYAGELALEVSPVSEGGARLHRAVANITDCLSVPRLSREDFATGEPGYLFVGARAYGRSRTFLLQTGLQQLQTILDTLPI